MLSKTMNILLHQKLNDERKVKQKFVPNLVCCIGRLHKSGGQKFNLISLLLN